jgi:hypothetical protein
MKRQAIPACPDRKGNGAKRLLGSFSQAVYAILLCAIVCAGQSASQYSGPSPNRNPPATEGRVDNSAATDTEISADVSKSKIIPAAGEPAETRPPSQPQPQFRIERISLIGGAELLTLFGRMDGMRSQNGFAPEVPLLSVLRDTLTDNNQENDRLSYVWMLTYTRPNLMKRFASAIPFLYQHVGSQRTASSNPPKPILDIANSDRQTWNHLFWFGLQNAFLDTYGIPLKASSRTYRQNAADYRKAHVLQALSVLDSFKNIRRRTRTESELLALTRGGKETESPSNASDTTTPMLPELSPAFTPGEMLELRARLILSTSTFGSLFGPDKFHGTVAKRSTNAVDTMGHNWEMLRQRAEAEGLYFEPLSMPDGQATHAILWISKADVAAQPSRSFSKRFLNIANPWNDERLRNWNGYTRTRYFDQENRPAANDVPGARPVEMIPLAVYGLDHPKIPALLIDFRDGLNPKGREMTRRAFSDVTRNVLSLSNFGNLPYFLGHKAYDFFTGRRGMDINQPSRVSSYSELKLLLSFNGSIEPKLRDQIERRLENVSLNPLNNDNQAEIQIARQQYDALMEYARRPDGLPAKIERDRRAEMVPLVHGSMARFFYTLGNVMTFGRYVHREESTAELFARMEMARRLKYHSDFLSEVARSSPQTEVAWDMETVKRSLEFLGKNGTTSNNSAARAAGLIFNRSTDPEARRLCLEALSKINNKTAREELLKIYAGEPVDSTWHAEAAGRLRKAVADDSRIKPSESKAVLNQVGQP